MIQIPQSTSRVVMLKLFTTGTTTAATGKTVAITISKNGAAFGNPNAGATNATEVSSGWYKVTLDTTDTGTVGDLVVRGTATGCDDTERIFGVVKATNGGLTALPDAAAEAAGGLFTRGTGAGQIAQDTNGRISVNVVAYGGSAGTFASGRPEVNTTHIAGTAWASTTLFTLASHDPGATLGTSTLTQAQVTGGAYALNSASFAFNSALDFTTTQKAATLARVTLTDTVTTYTGNTPQTGDAFARIGLAGVGLTNLGDTRIANLDATVSSRGTSTLTQAQVTGGAYALNSASFAFNAALPLTTQQKADVNAEADTAAADYGALKPTTAGRTLDVSVGGEAGIDWANVGTPGSTVNLSATTVNLTNTLTTYTGNTPQTGDAFARIGATGSGLTSLAPAATALSTATWTGTLATNLGTTNSTVATNLDAAVSTRLASASYTAPLDAAGTRTAVGLASANLDTQLSSIAGYIDTEVAAIKAKTDNLPAAPAAVGDIPTAAAIAAAWGSRVLGNGRTADMYLQGLTNKVEFAADGLTATLYSTDDTTPLATFTSTRLATTVGGLRSLDPA